MFEDIDKEVILLLFFYVFFFSKVFCERLESEFGIGVVATRPTVPFMVRRRDGRSVKRTNHFDLDADDERVFDDPVNFPPADQLANVVLLEPRCVATVVCPASMQGRILTLLAEVRGEPIDVQMVGGTGSAPAPVDTADTSSPDSIDDIGAFDLTSTMRFRCKMLCFHHSILENHYCACR